MSRYLLRRLAYLIPVWLGISFVAFALANLTPGDPARLMLQRGLGRQPTAEEVAAGPGRAGLNDAYIVRYGRGSVAPSRATSAPPTAPGSRSSALSSHAFRSRSRLRCWALLGAIAGRAASRHAGRGLAQLATRPLSRVLALVGASMPSYWVAYLLILLFAVRLQLLPVAGRGTWQH